ncbi:unnamed protein product [Eruca vesicaria subsp. sativa]|uniref:BAHD acyltransferase n=1 Tax=Eruca vesicaria subsp. sativa TaxID=29727 RepID=A0ABC8M300_ERUVS|nr:unnamed protein product [Eruca vesicaria subsp. sativa]
MVLNVIKISHISPSTDSFSDPLVVPLTFFDLKWLKDSVQQVVFYKLTDSSSSSRDFFYSVIIPKLETSLSLVLGHFLPLAGHVTWNPQDPKPCIVVSPHDTVSLTISESNADFTNISGKGIRLAKETRSLVQEFPASCDSPRVLSLQVTLFPNQGLSIGITANHAVMDGKTVVNFYKSWAYICKSQTHGNILLPDDLTPRLDRTIINVPSCLEAKMLELQGERTLKIPQAGEIGHDIFRITLELTRENVEKLKVRAKNESTRACADLYLSTFVLAYAYMWTCLLKTRGGHGERPVRLMYAADFRNRLDPPVHETYVGNCVFPIGCFGHEAKTFLGEDGFVKAVEILGDSVKGLSLLGIEELCELYVEGKKRVKPGTQLGTIAGSNRFGLYGSDFGWGNPVNTEFVSIDRNEAFSMSERRDRSGGVQVGLCLKKHEMDIFVSLFNDGLVN